MMKKPNLSKDSKDERPTVLLVEDDRELRALLARIFTQRGWHVVTARDGLSALQVLEEFHVDALVTDLHLAGGPTGEKLLEYAKRRCPNCRLVLVSGLITRIARASAEACGAAIFEKPVDVEEILKVIGRGIHEEAK